jgi:hypothetical protein
MNTPLTIPQSGGCSGPSRSMEVNITTTRNLLSVSWMGDIDALEKAIRRLTSRRRLTNNCSVALFELAGDRNLHVNVTHGHRTRAPRGWAGPAVLPQGFVHNRTFGEMPSNQIVRQIGEMVFSARI